MQLYISLLKRYIQYYYNHKQDIIGYNALRLATTLTSLYDLYFFNNIFDRNTIIVNNKQFNLYLQSENKYELQQMIIEQEKNIPNIFAMMSKIDEVAEELGVDTGFYPNKWGRNILGVEIL